MSDRQYHRLLNRRARRLLAWLARQFVADMRAAWLDAWREIARDVRRLTQTPDNSNRSRADVTIL